MKQTKFLLGACLALTLAGCSDEVGITADQLPVSGDEITFGAAAGQFTEPTKRTTYDFVGDENYSHYQQLAIKWVPGQDQVRVYCPNPSEQQWADYTVMAGTTGAGETASDFYLQRTNENAQGVRWGNDLKAEHKFYSFYPLKTSNGAEISGLKSDTKVRATIPTAQLSGEVTSNTDPNIGRTWYVVEPDMSYAMMVGTGTWTPGTDKNVTLNYKPIVTVLDVYVNGPDVNDQTEVNYTITGVGVRSASQPIVGTFEYDLAAEAGSEFTYLTPEGDSQDDNWAYVEVAGVDGNGQVLNRGEGMNVKFFLMPQDINPSELTVYVFLSNGSVLSQPLSADNSEGSATTIAKGEIVKVLTPKVNPAPVSNWMSAIGNDVLFASQLSLPGTKHSYSYIAYESNTIFGDDEHQSYDANSDIMQTYQTLNISQQFDAGVRAFNVKLNANPDVPGYPGQPCVYLGNQNVTDETIKGLLDELKAKLDASPTEFVVLTIDFVNDKLSRQAWLDAVVGAIDDWSRDQGPVNNKDIDDGTDYNDNDQDYFREVTATTTVGNMRHGIGVVILVPESVDNDNQPVSWTSQNVNVIQNFDSSVQNTSIWNASMSSKMGSADIAIQNLQQVNNPTLDAYPYFITEQYVLNSTSMDLIEAKKTLMRLLMLQSRQNNTGASADKTNHLYINDLSGFCVVDNDDSKGWADAEWSEAYDGALGYQELHWDYNGIGIGSGFDATRLTDYRNYANYTFFTDPDHQGAVGSTPVPDRPTADGQTALRITGRGSTSRGQGGNAALLAQYINPEAERQIRAFVNDGRTPLGIVFMNFAGTQAVEFNRTTYTVYGETLPALIVANNFKFALATSKTAQQGN